MKSFYPPVKSALFFAFLFLVLCGNAQQTEFNYGNRWRFGLNVGGMWQASDMTNYAGTGGGFTIEKGLTKRKTALLSFDLRYRFLAGSMYGRDNRVNRALSQNAALNGQNDSTVNYTISPGYFFNNYKTKIASNDLELKIGFNRLLEKTNIHLYFWGGIGVTRFNTKIDALDANGSMYNFSGVDTTGGKASMSSLTFFDGKYETNANGNEGSGKTTFSPSLGAGFGYRFGKHFSLILEHKITFPGSDLMDGEQSFQKVNKWSSKNDYYHYAGLKAQITFGRAGGTSSTYTNPNNYTASNNPPEVKIISPSSNPYTSPANNVQVYANVKYVATASGISVLVNGVPFAGFNFTPSSGALSFSTPLQIGANVISITGNNNYGTDNETVTVNYGPPQGQPPIVSITAPANGSTTDRSTTNVTAIVRNVTQNNQVQVNVNGSLVSNFTFNGSTGDVSFVAPLNSGNNTITVTGTNQHGTDSKSITVYQITAQPKPVVTITNPPAAGQQVSSPSFTVAATVTNITSSAQLVVLVNGVQVSNFTFNAANGSLSIPAMLNPGSNNFVITATNTAGSDTKATSLVYAGLPPVVTFTNPAANPYTSTTPTVSVQAKVTEVSGRNDIKVYINNVLDNNFNYNPTTKIVDFTVALTAPVHVVTVVATNNWGNDTKSLTVNYNAVTNPKPVVIISNPVSAPHTTTSSAFTVNATVNNVAAKSQITVKVNGSATTNFTYNMLTKQVAIPLTLAANVSTPVIITATNNAGSDTKNTSITYLPKPVVTYINPSTDPYSATSAAQTITAEVKHVTQQSQVNILVNGVPVNNFTWNASNNQATFNATLNIGNNVVNVTGTNTSGTDSKPLTITVADQPRGARPVVTITNPPAPGTTVNAAPFVFTASVMNVNSVNEIAVKFNGVTVTPQYTSGVVTYTATLQTGNNTFSVAATTANGSDQASTTINYVLPTAGKGPGVTITNPATPGTTVSSSAYQFIAVATGVNSASQVTATFNGAPVTIQYNNGTVTYNANLISGNNTFSVTATNSSASKSASTSINYVAPPQGNPPVVTITNPATNGTTVSSSAYSFSATVTNVTSASQVSVTFNGASVNAQYNNGTVTYNGTLISGVNSFVVSATNNFGTHAATGTITYTALPQGNPPVVTITNPATQNAIANGATYPFKANVTNVTSASQVTATLNGTVVNAQFANGVVTYTGTLNSGTNTFSVTATNNFGTHSAAGTVKKVAVLQGNPPVVTITNPSAPGSTVSAAAYQFSANVTNVTQANQVTVTLNGSNVSSQYSNGVVTYNATLASGLNAFVVSANNDYGTDSKSTTITYNVPVAPPVITFNAPAAPGQVANTSAFFYKAKITNITSNSQLVVKYNGQVVSGFSFMPALKSFTYAGNLQTGNNTLEITATNSGGSDYKSTYVVYQVAAPADTSRETPGGGGTGPGGTPPLNNPGGSTPTNDPTITICHYPPGNTSNPQVIQIPQSAWAAHQAHGDVLGGTCPQTNPGNGNNNNPGGNTPNNDPNITICHYPPGNTSNPQVIQIPQSAWAAHQAHGDVLGGTCPQTNPGNGNNGGGNNNNPGGGNSNNNPGGNTPNNDPNITICHYPPGNTSNPQVIQIPQSAWAAHQAHGDVLGGTCPQTNPGNGNNGGGNNNNPGGGNSNNNPGGNTPNNDPNITICHYPPGNTSNPQVIQIPQSAWAAHQAHGDVLGGTCPQTNPGNGNNGGGNNNNPGGGNSNNNPGGNTPNNDPNITICHYPPGNTSNPQVIQIPQSAWAAHQAHGDVLGGTCPQTNPGNGNNGGGNNNNPGGGNSNNNPGGNTPNNDPNITICHYPPGNTSNPQVIQIPQSAWAAHQAHGDVLGGTCPQNNNGEGNNNSNNSNSGSGNSNSGNDNGNGGGNSNGNGNSGGNGGKGGNGGNNGGNGGGVKLNNTTTNTNNSSTPKTTTNQNNNSNSGVGGKLNLIKNAVNTGSNANSNTNTNTNTTTTPAGTNTTTTTPAKANEGGGGSTIKKPVGKIAPPK